MKKILALGALIALTACSNYYDYYKGDVRYVQYGDDCIYSSGEYSRKYSNRVDAADLDKRIVYRNTSCADLYARDMMGQEPRHERRVLTPAADVAWPEPEVVVEPQPIVVKQLKNLVVAANAVPRKQPRKNMLLLVCNKTINDQLVVQVKICVAESGDTFLYILFERGAIL